MKTAMALSSDKPARKVFLSSIALFSSLVVLRTLVAVNNIKGGSIRTITNTSNIQISYNKDGPTAEGHHLRLAWLMSFPNSGTSYTLKLVRHASELATATNYCGKPRHHITVPVFDTNGVGPNILDEKELPLDYILTKTHCAGKCNDFCPPSKYVVTAEKFQTECLAQCYTVPGPHDTRKEMKRGYNASLIGKAIHMFRDPYDNILSRFHLHTKSSLKQGRDDVNNFTSDVEGFQAFCNAQNAHWVEEEAQIFSEAITVAADGVPCHADFFRYVQWHNHAFEITRNLSIPTYILHYGDYQDDFDGTLASVLSFLELRHVSNDLPSFHWSNYTSYYTDSQRRAIVAYAKELASPDTWNELLRYGFH